MCGNMFRPSTLKLGNECRVQYYWMLLCCMEQFNLKVICWLLGDAADEDFLQSLLVCCRVYGAGETNMQPAACLVTDGVCWIIGFVCPQLGSTFYFAVCTATDQNKY